MVFNKEKKAKKTKKQESKEEKKPFGNQPELAEELDEHDRPMNKVM